MNRRSFLGMSVAGFASLFLPKLEIGETMQLGDLLVKVATNQNLNQRELDFLRLEGNNLQLRAAFVAGNTTPQNTLNVPMPFAPIFSEVLAVDTAELTIQIPGGYKHLLMFGSGRSTAAGASTTGTWMQFNGDTGNNYAEELVVALGSAILDGTETDPTDKAFLVELAQADQVAGYSGAFFAFITGYSAGFFKTVQDFSRNTDSGAEVWGAASTVWRSTAAIETIRIFPEAALIAAGSTISIYGIL